MSCDSHFSHAAFAEKCGGFSYPLLSDFHPKGQVAQLYGVYNPDSGASRRATFLIDKEGVVRYAKLHDPGTLPNDEELLAELAKF